MIPALYILITGALFGTALHLVRAKMHAPRQILQRAIFVASIFVGCGGVLAILTIVAIWGGRVQEAPVIFHDASIMVVSD